MHLTPKPLIDSQLGLSVAERRSVRIEALRVWMAVPRNSVLYGVGLVALLASFMFLPDIVEPWIGGRRWWLSLVWLGLYVLGIFGLFMLIRRLSFAPMVYAELRKRGHDVCRRCGYVLSGLPKEQTTSPECGDAGRGAE